MRVAVAHEWLTNWAGSERVVEQIVRCVDPVELVASVVDADFARARFPSVPVHPLWPSRLPGATEHWSRYALAMIAAWRTTKIEADALVVSSHFAAHGATARFDGPSIVYYHTPARLLWRPELELGRLPAATRGVIERLGLPPLRALDRQASRHPTVLLANSTAVAQRIETAYRRSAQVLHPPVDVDRWLSVPRSEPGHLLWFGRLVAYKRPDLAIEVARRTGLPMIVVGDGPARAELEAAAPPNVRFLGHAPESDVRDAMSHACALLFPGEEDFGIAPVEALAAGVPVIAYAAGGATDYVDHGKNGLLVAGQDPDSFAAAVHESQRISWDVRYLRDSATPFTEENFRRGFAAVLDATLGSSWRPAGRPVSGELPGQFFDEGRNARG